MRPQITRVYKCYQGKITWHENTAEASEFGSVRMWLESTRKINLWTLDLHIALGKDKLIIRKQFLFPLCILRYQLKINKCYRWEHNKVFCGKLPKTIVKTTWLLVQNILPLFCSIITNIFALGNLKGIHSMPHPPEWLTKDNYYLIWMKHIYQFSTVSSQVFLSLDCICYCFQRQIMPLFIGVHGSFLPKKNSLSKIC